MRTTFSTPIHLAHHFWTLHYSIAHHDGIVIDATCGNGKDAFFLACLLQGSTTPLWCIDIQEISISHTKSLLSTHPHKDHIHFLHGSHTELPKEPIQLIVYNLGYLPKGDKRITTMTTSSIISIQNALSLLAPEGLISIICYSGHAEGAREAAAILELASSLAPSTWCVTHMTWPNRNQAPSLLLITKDASH